MALIVEDGTGKVDSESYETATAATTYHASRGNTAFATLTEAQKEIALRKATDYLTQAYRASWKGYRTKTTQALDFPREDIEVDYIRTLANSIIPQELKNACAELALTSLTENLNPQLGRPTIEETVCSLTVKYSDSATQVKKYRAIDMMLMPFLSGKGGANTALIRS